MQFDAELLLLAMAPVDLACVGCEAWRLSTRARAPIHASATHAAHHTTHDRFCKPLLRRATWVACAVCNIRPSRTFEEMT
jgi:hypothetical protein